jgi:uncharacterized membrane protein YecN with MAPEG domain
MKITALYAGLLALLFLVLSFRTILYRRAQKVEIGDGGDRELLRRARVHANFAEYVPLALLLMGLAESLGLPGFGLHVMGIVLLAGRISHAWGLSQNPHLLQFRVAGVVATTAVLFAGALACIALSITAMR